MSQLLLVDRDKNIRKSVSLFFSKKGHTVESAIDYKSSIERIERENFDIIICDAQIENGNLVALIRAVKERNPTTLVIIATALDTVEDTVQAMKEGAFGLVTKPINIYELEVKVEKAIEIKRLQLEAQSLRGERKLIYKTDDIIGECPQIKKVFQTVDKIAETTSSVILIGETGTGKELIAGAIHYNSQRRNGAFVKVNCAALPEQLLESELFGHEKGAFTGADKLRIGRFEQADGGTIFLDEIADMSLVTQAKVLRVLQEKEFERIGSNKTVKTDVRIISATNKNLKSLIAEGQFREDLYYRLHVISIRIPTLRERGGDIIRLAHFFLSKYAADLNKGIKGFHSLAIEALTEYHWPGNVRELENAVERAVIMAEGVYIKAEELNISDYGDRSRSGELHPDLIKLPPQGIKLDEMEKALVLQALERCEWVQKDAAALLGISKRVFNYKIKHFNITHPRWIKNR